MSDKNGHSFYYKVIHVHSHTQPRWTVLYFEPIVITFYTNGWQLFKLKFQKVILAFRTLRISFQKNIKDPLQKEATYCAILYIDIQCIKEGHSLQEAYNQLWGEVAKINNKAVWNSVLNHVKAQYRKRSIPPVVLMKEKLKLNGSTAVW